MRIYFWVFVIVLITLLSCRKSQNDFDATGSFESKEILISAEGSGILKLFTVEEGSKLLADSFVGYIDTTQLYLKKKQLESQVKSTLSQKPDIAIQLSILESQLKSLERDRERFTNLVQ